MWVVPFYAKKFSKLMASCKGLITTGADIAAKGIGISVSQIDQGILERMLTFDAREYWAWVDQAGKAILNSMKE